MTTYLLKPRLPGGTWLAIVLLLVGGSLVAITYLGAAGVWRVVGAVMAALALALLVVTIVATVRRRVRVSLDDEGYVIEGPYGEFSGEWLNVTNYTVSRRTAKIALWHGPRRRTIIAHPAGQQDEEFMQLREDIRTHLEALG